MRDSSWPALKTYLVQILWFLPFRSNQHAFIIAFNHAEGAILMIIVDIFKVLLENLNFAFQYYVHFVSRCSLLGDNLASTCDFLFSTIVQKDLSFFHVPVTNVRDLSTKSYIGWQFHLSVFLKQSLKSISMDHGKETVSECQDSSLSRLSTQ